MESFSSDSGVFPKKGNGDFKYKSQQKIEAKREKHAEALKNFDLKSRSNVKNGMVKERSCTNCFMLIIFVGMISAMLYLSIYSYQHGNVKKLIAPVDG